MLFTYPVSCLSSFSTKNDRGIYDECYRPWSSLIHNRLRTKFPSRQSRILQMKVFYKTSLKFMHSVSNTFKQLIARAVWIYVSLIRTVFPLKSLGISMFTVLNGKPLQRQILKTFRRNVLPRRYNFRISSFWSLPWSAPQFFIVP